MKQAFQGKRIGVALTGSFCTFETTFEVLRGLKENGAELYPIMSHNAYTLDTRFYRAENARTLLEGICENPIWHEIVDVEPIGPKKLLDLLIVIPCTGNTLAKLAHGIADTSVTMACKSHWRNDRPVLIGLSTNDGLAGSASNVGRLMARRNIFFIPYGQDDSTGKPSSLVFLEDVAVQAAEAALENRQLQPLLRQ